MLFIDGTWLYYSLYHRQSSAKQAASNACESTFGPGWTHTHKVRWDRLPGIIADAIKGQENKQQWGTGGDRQVEVVRANVYTGYKQGTDPQSNRVKMFEGMRANKFDVHLEATNGHSEKCIDIQLAVEMLHYATEADAYDVAVILTGDRDFEPAMYRTRQKGKRVALCSMRAGCNKALSVQGGEKHLRDYDVIWLDDEDNLRELVGRKEEEGEEGGNDGVTVNAITVIGAIERLCDGAGGRKVTGRMVGRFLKGCRVESSTHDLLAQVKTVAGGLNYFLSSYPDFFQIQYPESNRGKNPKGEANDFYVTLKSRSGARIKQLWADEVREGRVGEEEGEFVRNLKITEDVVNGCEVGDVQKYAPSMQQQQVKPDFGGMTVVQLKDKCKKVKVKVSGSKAELVGRLVKKWEEDNAPALSSPPAMKIRANKDVKAHLVTVVKDVIRSSGGKGGQGAKDRKSEAMILYCTANNLLLVVGKIGSRDLGRFMSKVPPSNPRHASALQELKSSYLSINKFLNENRDQFEYEEGVGKSVYTSEYGFAITLAAETK